MKNKTFWLLGVFAGVVVLVAGIFVGVANRADRAGNKSAEPAPPEIIRSESGEYSFRLPSGWYLERNDASGVTVYPDYDPRALRCKIEVSALDGGVSDLDAWITSRLAADPTGDNVEFSRIPKHVGGRPAIEWRGAMNGVTTTLDYVSAGQKVFEIAPSALGETDTVDNDSCAGALEKFTSKIIFETP